MNIADAEYQSWSSDQPLALLGECAVLMRSLTSALLTVSHGVENRKVPYVIRTRGQGSGDVKKPEISTGHQQLFVYLALHLGGLIPGDRNDDKNAVVQE